jgi:hypothetical protein
LILDLLNREPGVNWARRVGKSSATDGGRDILVDWVVGPAPWQDATPEESMIRRRVVVQCKAYTTSINLSKLPDIPQVLDLHNATGYMLIAFPQITPQVVDYMTRVPAQRKFWADWWTHAEIEDHLRSNLDITRRYRDLLTAKLVQAAASRDGY